MLLTGSAGFVGSHLAERLLNDGHSVTGVDNYISGQKRNTALLSHMRGFTFVEADVSLGIPYRGSGSTGCCTSRVRPARRTTSSTRSRR